MKKNLLFALPLALVVACSGEKTEEVVKLETDKQKLSYAIGASIGESLMKSGFERHIDLNVMAEAFTNSLNGDDYSDCQETIIGAFGMGFSNPDASKKVDGSKCLGKMTAGDFYVNMKQFGQEGNIDWAIVGKGHKDALNGADTLVSAADKASLLTKFQSDIQSAQINKAKEAEKPFFDNAKALPNTKVIDGGIVIETLSEGKGGSPKASDDVKAHYTLTDVSGQKIESSLDRGEPLVISLQQVIPGWTMSFPHLNKGGKYRLYIPQDLAYGSSKGALCFEIELIDFGANGTLK